MNLFYQQDLAYIQATAFGTFAGGAAPEIIHRLRAASVSVRHVIEVGCGAGPLTQALIEAGFGVTAIEPSADLLAAARAALPPGGVLIFDVIETGEPSLTARVEFRRRLGDSRRYP